jgi:predicted transcriptional regulator
MSTKMQLQWRRRQVFDLNSKGQSQTEIAKTLQISESTISRDLDYIREQSKKNIRRYIDERLPEEYEKCLVGLNAITKEAWNTAQNTEDKREKIQALSLAKECYSMKLELLTNAAVVEDAIRFVSAKSKENLKFSTGDATEESNEPDYNEDKEDQPEAEDEKIITSSSSTTTTTNQIF